MKIAFNTQVLQSSHQGRGVGTYTRELSRALSKLKTPHQILLTSNPYQTPADLVHHPYFDFFRPSLPLHKPHPTIVTIHDTIPLLFPQHFPVGIRGKLSLIHQQLSLKSVRAVITDSNQSAADIKKYLGLPSAKIHPIPLAASDAFKPAPVPAQRRLKRQLQLPDKFFLYVGDINYNKNLPRLIRALKSAPAANLVIVTRANLDQSIPEVQSIKQAISQSQVQNQVNFLKINSQSQLNTLYSLAYFYIQPSLYEGFGLPVLEAMKSGTPVLAANSSSLPEVTGKAALQFNPHSTHAISQAIIKALNLSHKKRQALINLGFKQAAGFSWLQTARATLKVYESVSRQT